jgi:3-oxoacyl-[acyl-carrier protein] reductase
MATDAAQPENARRELSGLTAVVTGAARGIGRAIALELAAAGAHVLVHARTSRAEADEVAAQASGRGIQSRVELCELGDDALHGAFCDAAWSWRGAVDIWVNNAGADVLTGAPARWSFERKLDELWRVDLLATIGLSRSVGARMKARGSGTIINVGWDQAEHGMAGDSGQLFATVKGGIMSFSKSLARSLAPEVRVNCVAPGWIKTRWGEGAPEHWQQTAVRQSLLERWGDVDDVAAAVRFLASPDASFITACVLPVNGGLRQL